MSNASEKQGKLKHWNEEKGFGFIALKNEPKDIFIHISSLKKMSRRPIIGDIITFKIHIDNNGKKRATDAIIKGSCFHFIGFGWLFSLFGFFKN